VANRVAEEGLAFADRFFHEVLCRLLVEERRHSRGGTYSHITVAHGKELLHVRDIERLLLA